MKLVVLALTGLFSVSGFAQIYFGTSHEYKKAKIFKKIDDHYHNNIIIVDPEKGYQQCQKDHGTILDIVRNQHKEHIARILQKINELSETKEYEGFAKGIINNELMNRVVHYMILSEMKKELQSKSIRTIVTDQYNPKIKNKRKVFEMKYGGVNVEAYFNEALNAAAKFKFNNSLPGWFIEEVKSSLISDIRKQLIKNTYKVVVNGVAIEFGKKVLAGQVTNAAFKSSLQKSVISFSGSVLASVGKGLLIELLTLPLKGSRLPPESLWLNLLEDYPGLMVNPELMQYAGINDVAWSTHCHTLNRRAHSFERKIEKLQESLRKEFGADMRNIDELIEREKHGFESHPRAVIDNTYVARKPIIK